VSRTIGARLLPVKNQHVMPEPECRESARNGSTGFAGKGQESAPRECLPGLGGMRASGGKYAYRSRFAKDLSRHHSRRSIASAKWPSPPDAVLSQALHQRQRFGDFRHLRRRRKAFERRREDGVGVGVSTYGVKHL
jgi:hypothetical protein